MSTHTNPNPTPAPVRFVAARQLTVGTRVVVANRGGERTVVGLSRPGDGTLVVRLDGTPSLRVSPDTAILIVGE